MGGGVCGEPGRTAAAGYQGRTGLTVPPAHAPRRCTRSSRRSAGPGAGAPLPAPLAPPALPVAPRPRRLTAHRACRPGLRQQGGSECIPGVTNDPNTEQGSQARHQVAPGAPPPRLLLWHRRRCRHRLPLLPLLLEVAAAGHYAPAIAAGCCLDADGAARLRCALHLVGGAGALCLPGQFGGPRGAAWFC